MVEREKLVAMVCALQNHEPESAAKIYETFHSDIYYLILKTVNNDTDLAEDLTQDTFLKILEKIDDLKEPAAFVTWSKQIAYSKCTDYFHKRKELLADENEDGYSVFDAIEEDNAEFIPDAALDREDLKQTLMKLINELPEEQRSALILRYFNEISVKEIAQIQNVSEGTVKSRLNYARNAMRKSVEEYEAKNGIKLHCAGVLPLLLWLFKTYRVSNGMSLTSNTAAATFAAASATPATATASAAKTASAIGAKSLLTKVIAGVVALGITIGSLIAGVHIFGNSTTEINNSSSSKTEENENFSMITVYLESERIYDDGNICKYIYDKDSNLIEEVTYYNDHETNRITYTYDQDGNLIKVFDEDTLYYETYTYDQDGNRIESFGINGNYTYAYDKDGNLIEEIMYKFGEECLRHTYTYDKDGNIIEAFYYNRGYESNHRTYTYDKDGNLIEYVCYCNGKEDHRETYTYNKDGNLIEEVRYEKGEVYISRTCTYDKDGNLIEDIYYNSSNAYGRYTYAYDEHGNLIEEICYRFDEEYYHYAYAYDDEGNVIRYENYSNGELRKSRSYSSTYIAVTMTHTQAKKLGLLD